MIPQEQSQVFAGTFYKSMYSAFSSKFLAPVCFVPNYALENCRWTLSYKK